MLSDSRNIVFLQLLDCVKSRGPVCSHVISRATTNYSPTNNAAIEFTLISESIVSTIPPAGYLELGLICPVIFSQFKPIANGWHTNVPYSHPTKKKKEDMQSC